jgi:hypothetical protein
MNANELRIGNKALLTDINEICIITSISNKYIGYETKSRIGECIPSCLNPIPLTKEWLLKFGFDGCTAPNKSIKVGYNDDDFIHNQMSLMFKRNIIIKLNYVHQLQNLYFALTGKELVVSDAVS